MTDRPQLDLFPDASEPFDPDRAPVAYRPDPDDVRKRLHAILDEARAATTLPWKQSDVVFYRTVFPQMTRWLPDEEAAQLCFAFEEEMTRLKAA